MKACGVKIVGDNIMDEEVDLFEDQDSLPDDVRAVLDHFSEKFEVDDGDAYLLCKDMQLALNELGYEMDYGLDGVPYGLHEDPDLMEQRSGPRLG